MEQHTSLFPVAVLHLGPQVLRHLLSVEHKGSRTFTEVFEPVALEGDEARVRVTFYPVLPASTLLVSPWPKDLATHLDNPTCHRICAAVEPEACLPILPKFLSSPLIFFKLYKLFFTF